MKFARLSFLAFLALITLSNASFQANGHIVGTGTLRITIRDPHGNVVPGASVSARKAGCKCSDCAPPEKPCKCCFQQATSNDSGEVAFTLESGTYSVTVGVTGFESVEQDVEVRDGESKSLEMKVGSTGLQTKQGKNDLVFSGTIQDQSDHSIANVEVLVGNKPCKCSSCAENEKPCKCCFSQRTVSNASGKFSITGLEPGSYFIQLTKDGRTLGSINGLEIQRSENVQLTVVEGTASMPPGTPKP